MRASASVLAFVILSGCASVTPPDANPGAATLALSCPPPCVGVIDDERLPGWEPDVAVDPQDDQHVLVVHAQRGADPSTRAPTYWPFAHVSRDGGATWTHARFPGGPTASPTHPLFAFDIMGDQTVVLLPDKTALAAVIVSRSVNSPTGGGIVNEGVSLAVLRSADGGASWPEVPLVIEGSGVNTGLPLDAPAWYVAADYPKLAAGPDGSVMISWVRNEADGDEHTSDIMTAASQDGGRTWGAPVVVATSGALNGVSAAIDSTGTRYVAYFERFTTPQRDHLPLFVATSRDGGATWTSAEVGVAAWMPTLRAADHEGRSRLYLAYPMPVEGKADHERPVLRWSDDGGVTWSEPLALDEPVAPGRTLVALAARNDTALLTSFHVLSSQRGSARAELRAVAVRDGRVSDAILLDDPINAFPAELGDYVGLAATQRGAYSAWVQGPDKGKPLVGARLALSYS